MTPITLTDWEVSTSAEILTFLDEFLRTASPAVREELSVFGAAHGEPHLTSWLLDVTGIMARSLDQALSLAQHIPAPNAAARS